MPSTYQSGGSLSYNPHPNLVKDYGENPARFLAMDNLFTAVAIIRGIDDVGRANAWRAVELREFGGRDTVIEALDERLAELRGDDE